VKIFVTDFAKRHFDVKFAGTKILEYTPEGFADHVNDLVNGIENMNRPKFQKGYAPFCKHIFLENFTQAKSGVIKITKKNEKYLKSGYNARREFELPVLSRWFEATDVRVPKAKYLDLILYSVKQLKHEGKETGIKEVIPVGCRYGIVSINGTLDAVEAPMPPATMVRNALGVEEGGSGVALDRDLYVKSVEYWNQYAIVL
jgi:hypothetical protein